MTEPTIQINDDGVFINFGNPDSYIDLTIHESKGIATVNASATVDDVSTQTEHKMPKDELKQKLLDIIKYLDS